MLIQFASKKTFRPASFNSIASDYYRFACWICCINLGPFRPVTKAQSPSCSIVGGVGQSIYISRLLTTSSEKKKTNRIKYTRMADNRSHKFHWIIHRLAIVTDWSVELLQVSVVRPDFKLNQHACLCVCVWVYISIHTLYLATNERRKQVK